MADVTEHGPRTELQQRFSSEGATATPWADVQDRLAGAEIWWLSTPCAPTAGRASRRSSPSGSTGRCTSAPWHFDVGDGVFLQEGSAAVVFEVRPVKAWGFGRERLYSATRWKF